MFIKFVLNSDICIILNYIFIIPNVAMVKEVMTLFCFKTKDPRIILGNLKKNYDIII